MLESSICFVEMSALVFCLMVRRVGGVLRGCLLPGSVAVGVWSLCLGVAGVRAGVGYFRYSVLKSAIVRGNRSAASYCILC